MPAPKPLALSFQSIDSQRRVPGAFAWDPAWLLPDEASDAFEVLCRELALAAHDIRIFGRLVPQPRLSLWMGDHAYRYSGKTFVPAPWHPRLRAMCDRLSHELDVPFNSVLCNLYRDGHDSMGSHADDEPELGPQPVIASVSLGATRRFTFQARGRDGLGRPPERRALELSHGSLLVMDGATQQHWKHALPKSVRVTAPRLNLTFRRVFPELRSW